MKSKEEHKLFGEFCIQVLDNAKDLAEKFKEIHDIDSFDEKSGGFFNDLREYLYIHFGYKDKEAYSGDNEPAFYSKYDYKYELDKEYSDRKEQLKRMRMNADGEITFGDTDNEHG